MRACVRVCIRVYVCVCLCVIGVWVVATTKLTWHKTIIILLHVDSLSQVFYKAQEGYLSATPCFNISLEGQGSWNSLDATETELS